MSKSTDPGKDQPKPAATARKRRLPAWFRWVRLLLAQIARGAAYGLGSAGVTSLLLWWQNHH
ncbi:hypothetical protein SRIMHP_16455 [Streptomyces rimosus subsp. rimosus]|uniref:Uncharacterized protein n=1 Tax=Streptomyces rimosus subsp. rimosus TaxID=132474 RepID=A0ABY3Z257_STRRM|nr:hypothetical protein SRIMR7_18820 [Streptomyces rimosus subsp. rimosus]UTH95720.1 hypothetical protein SRIMHP_16455 [Streptomyces rimosus subsp. rimosus]UTJ13817.1 hypothetical protein SRIMDV3_16350 [Streptomyces rimosus subsp. rimosus]